MARRRSTELDYAARVLAVQAYVDAHLDDPLAPAQLAAVACLSLHHFHRVFRGVTGESLQAYIRRRKLERAARRLRAGDTSIAAIAFEAGYGSHEAFTRAFTSHFGKTPARWRGEPPPHVARAPVPPVDVEIRDEPAIPIVFLRQVGPYSGAGALFDRLFAWAAARGIDGRALGRCPDDPDVTPESHLRFDACLEVPTNTSVDDPELTRGTIPAGRYAVAVHRGPFSTLFETYLALIGGWAPRTRYALADEPVIEVYLDDPALVPPEALRTEVRVRLED